MTNDELNLLLSSLGKIGLIVMVLPIIVSIWQKKYLNKPLKVFLWYQVFVVLFNLLEQVLLWYITNYDEAAEPWLDYWEIADANFLSILYQLNNFFWLGWFYYLLTLSKYGIWIKRIAALLFSSVLVNYLFLDEYHGSGKFNPAATTIFTFGVAFFYLWYLYRTQLAVPLKKNPYFWMTLALIIPYLASFFHFLVGDLSYKSNLPLFVTTTFSEMDF